MKTLTVQGKERSYPIYIGNGLLEKVPSFLKQHHIETDCKLMIVTDTHVAPLYAGKLRDALEQAGFQAGISVVEAGEKSKSLQMLEHLTGECLKFGLDRRSVILALGGGVVGDLAGFLAASYMRGIPFIQIPTTLLAHDSSVGGKVAVNHPMGKNYIGAFHQPLMVVFDVACLKTLPAREWRSGMAEVIKHGLIRDASFVEWLDEHRESLDARDHDAMMESVYRGCKVKADVVSQDERETGLRAILNYGHTIGHALEAVSGYQVYTHGEAISIGMNGAAQLSERLLGTNREVIRETGRILKSFGLPVVCTDSWPVASLIGIMKRDKKAQQGKYVFVLARDIGKVEIVRDVPEEEIKRVLQQLLPDREMKS